MANQKATLSLFGENNEQNEKAFARSIETARPTTHHGNFAAIDGPYIQHYVCLIRIRMRNDLDIIASYTLNLIRSLIHHPGR